MPSRLLPKDSAPPKRKLAQASASKIQREIIQRGWPVGEVLGSETQLIERLGVSRAVFREAVRLLEHQQVARMRSGPGGGLVVIEPDADAVVSAARLYLVYSKATGLDVFKVRQSIELLTVQIVAENVTETGVATLRAALAAELDRQQQRSHIGSSDVHIAIADLTGNAVMSLFLRVLTKLTAELAPAQHSAPSAEAQGTVRRAHELIVEAIVSGDPALARHRMLRHLEGITKWLGC